MHKFLTLIVAITVSACFLLPHSIAQVPPQSRTWTDSTGKFEIEATFEKLENGNVHLIRTDNGETVVVPVRRLSQSDLALIRSMARSEPARGGSSSVPAAAPRSGGETKQMHWEGTWNNRKYGTSGPVACTAVAKDDKTWAATFTGKGLGKPFKYEVLITATAKGDQTQLQGISKVDGDTYRWNGYVRGQVLYGRYRSGSGNNGEFQLKAGRSPVSTNRRPPTNSRVPRQLPRGSGTR